MLMVHGQAAVWSQQLASIKLMSACCPAVVFTLLPLCRCRPGAVYRPHVDGAWPGSGVDPATGEYVFEAYGDRWSRLTFLVYLNNDFEGGCTTYYTPSEYAQLHDLMFVHVLRLMLLG